MLRPWVQEVKLREMAIIDLQKKIAEAGRLKRVETHVQRDRFQHMKLNYDHLLS